MDYFMEEPILNAHNKEEYPPMHTAEHILNGTIEFMPREQAADIVDLSKLPEDASETLRIVRVGDYDACACIGAHVKNTAEIGTFKILSHDYEDGRWRVRWKVQ